MDGLFDNYIEKIQAEISAQANKIAQDEIKQIEGLIIQDISDRLGVNNLEERIKIPIKKGRPPVRVRVRVPKKPVNIKKKKKPAIIIKKSSRN